MKWMEFLIDTVLFLFVSSSIFLLYVYIEDIQGTSVVGSMIKRTLELFN